jgi:GTPase-associated system helical domain
VRRTHLPIERADLMIRKLYDWYRVVDPDPKDEKIQKRRLAIEQLVSRLLKEDGYQGLIASTEVVANGFRKGSQELSGLAQTVVSCIRESQPAFSDDLSENALELRICCTVALGEIIINDSNKKDISAKVQLAASLLLSAMGLRPPVKKRFLQPILVEMQNLSIGALKKVAEARRDRSPINPKYLDSYLPKAEEDIATYMKRFLPVLKAIFTFVERKQDADREELDVLWWLYNGFSEEMKLALVDLKPSEAAICCGVEVADIVLPPPIDSIPSMAMQAIVKGRKKADLVTKPFNEMVREWREGIAELLAPSDGDLMEMVRGYPAILPLSWLCLRLSESEGTSEWEKEFEKKTGISPSLHYEPTRVAVQALNERVSQRIYRSLL